METIINALLEIFSAHNFGACTNVSCIILNQSFAIDNCNQTLRSMSLFRRENKNCLSLEMTYYLDLNIIGLILTYSDDLKISLYYADIQSYIITVFRFL